MTRIFFYWDEDAFVGLEASEHSGCGEEGTDVVCAAVSALLHALLLGLSDVAKEKEARTVWDPESVLIKAFWPREKAETLSLLTETIALSLKEIASGYPGHVSISEVQL
ncbi:MAG: ribosomal-processing cysteine protease Prp [Fretibacterium sp.]|nr:ribosomal-processing cysteine protease Prp [Fretibacterium sp.]